MSVAPVEIVMDGVKPVRVIVRDGDGIEHALEGIADVNVEIPNHGPQVVTLRILAEVSIRKAYPEELDGPTDT